MSQRSDPVSQALTPQVRFLLVYGATAAFFALGSMLVFWWIYDIIQSTAPAPTTSPIYANYDPAGDHLKPESLAAMAAYTEANPQPQNVQVLKGWSTAQISAYMVAQVSGGLKVDCSYCHNVANFAEEGNVKKTNARAMMLMAADLNRSYIAQLPASVGNYQVTCATCHNGKPVFETYPIAIQNTLPNDFKLPLDRNYPGGLVVTGRDDVGLEDVELNQYTMYHYNVSLGQGCTFCHNARYFPSYEIAQKKHATIMMQMAQHINNTYSRAIMAGKTPSCWMCHQGAQIPPGAATDGQVPPMLSKNGK
ncbi:MAG: photosynthetic reaction center cytochrome c subunit [Chloroflexi bacterium]|nr:photosynthetic reaction center cytochrome c subunit [Chloroflexota bacterium]